MRTWRGGVITIVICLVCIAGEALAADKAGAPPPPAVTVATVPVKDVAPVYSFIGHIQAIQSVQVVPRVTAFIEQEPAAQGSDVKAGQVLFELQEAQYQAAVQSAQAQLDSANAAVTNARLAYDRAARLNQQGFEAQSNLDQARATLQQDQANVLGAQANLAQAALNLSYCTIRSPIDGRLGVITLTKGNLVTPSTPALATINQMDPIRVVFSVSDRTLVGVKQTSGATESQIAAGLTLNLELSNGKQYNQTGKITFLNNQVDTATGTVSVYADFPNPDRLLLPGAYATVQVHRSKPEDRPLVPVAALQTNETGSFVLVVGPDNKIKQQPVTLGRQLAQDYIVQKGLSGGERVVVAGLQKVRPGETVNPVTEAAPAAAAQNANPGESG